VGLTLLTAPSSEPFTLGEAKEHLRESDSTQDSTITSLITAAREYAEGFTRRALITQSWRLSIDSFPLNGVIRLPMPPLVAVNSVKYTDLSGAEVTLDPSQYYVDKASLPGKIDRAYMVIWPLTRCIPNAVRIEFDCGFGDANAVPEGIKAAMKLMLSHWYENREPVNIGSLVTQIPLTVDSLLWRWRCLEAA
jgi:uncharacterized phiE125 gp8 family phage protein